MSIKAVSANHSKVKANQFKEHLSWIIYLRGLKLFIGNRVKLKLGSKMGHSK
jgi:hypothetical protein